MALLPRSITVKTWAACLERQARRLRSLTANDAIRKAHRRSGFAGVAGAAAKADARLRKAAEHEHQATVLAEWVAIGLRGGDLDPAVVGLVCAYLHGHGAAIPDLLARAAAIGRNDGPRHVDVILFLEWILEVF